MNTKKNVKIKRHKAAKRPTSRTSATRRAKSNANAKDTDSCVHALAYKLYTCAYMYVCVQGARRRMISILYMHIRICVFITVAA